MRALIFLSIFGFLESTFPEGLFAATVCPSAQHHALGKSTSNSPELSRKSSVRALFIPIQYLEEGREPLQLPRHFEKPLRDLEAYIHEVSGGRQTLRMQMLGHVEGADTFSFTHPQRAEEVLASVADYIPKIGNVHAQILWQVHAEYGDIFKDVDAIFFLHQGKVLDGYTGYGAIGDISSFPYYRGPGLSMLEHQTPDIHLYVLVHEYGHLLDLWHPPENALFKHYGIYNVMENVYEDDGIGDNVTPFHPLDLLHLGWVDSQLVITAPGPIEIPDFSSQRVLVKVPLDTLVDEYFLLANYQGQGIFSRYRGTGVLIWHIRGQSIHDIEMPAGLKRMGIADPVFGEDWLDRENNGWIGGKEVFWEPGAGTAFTPYSNPSTAMYTGFSRHTAQARASGLSFTNFRYKEDGSRTMLLDFNREGNRLEKKTSQVPAPYQPIPPSPITESFAQGHFILEGEDQKLMVSPEGNLVIVKASDTAGLSSSFHLVQRYFLGNLTQDGILRLAAFSHKRSWVFRLQSQKWTADPATPVNHIASLEGNRIDFLDLNGDGRGDLAQFIEQGKKRTILKIQYDAMLGAGDQLQIDIGTRIQSSQFIWSDINADGYPDLIGGREILLNTGTGFRSIFDSSGISGAVGQDSLAHFSAADMNGDGLEEIVAVGSTGNLWLFLNLDGERFYDIAQLYEGIQSVDTWKEVKLSWRRQGGGNSPVVSGISSDGELKELVFPILKSLGGFAALRFTPALDNPLGLGVRLKVFRDKELFWSKEIYHQKQFPLSLDNLSFPVPEKGKASLEVQTGDGEKVVYSDIKAGQAIAMAERNRLAVIAFDSGTLLMPRLITTYVQKSGMLIVNTPRPGEIKVSMFDPAGNKLANFSAQAISSGRFSFPLKSINHFRFSARRICLIKTHVGGEVDIARVFF